MSVLLRAKTYLNIVNQIITNYKVYLKQQLYPFLNLLSTISTGNQWNIQKKTLFLQVRVFIIVLFFHLIKIKPESVYQKSTENNTLKRVDVRKKIWYEKKSTSLKNESSTYVQSVITMDKIWPYFSAGPKPVWTQMLMLPYFTLAKPQYIYICEFLRFNWR